MTPDLFNALFELGGALFIWLNVRKLYADKMTRGVYWPVNVFYTLWGVWNIFYYPAICQMLSFWAGIGVVLGNTAWCLLAYRYRKA